MTNHGADIFSLSGLFFNKMRSTILSNAKQITVVSAAIRNEIKSKLINTNKVPIEVIPMGVDLEMFDDHAEHKQKVNIKTRLSITKPLLLFVGTLTEKKGVEYLIKAMPKIMKTFPRAKLRIVGSGTLDKPLKILTKELFLTNNVIFIGGIPNRQLAQYYDSADILIVPSIKTKKGDVEGIPVVLMEGLASSKAIVASNIGGIPEIITHNMNGLLVPEKDSRSLAQSIITILGDNTLQSKLERGAKISSKNYDLKVVAEKFNKLYSQL